MQDIQLRPQARELLLRILRAAGPVQESVPEQPGAMRSSQKEGNKKLMDAKKLNAEDVRAALRRKYSDSRRYAVAEEVGLTTGYSHRRLDMMILDCYSSNGFRIDGIEIKVSTSDLRRELEEPEKHVAFFDVIDYYTLAVPPGVAEPLIDIIPKKWGILTVYENGSTRYKRRPLALEDRASDKPVPRGFFASITRAIQSRQPSAQELLAQYERGLKEGRESVERECCHMKERVEKNAERLKEYNELTCRLRLYGGDMEEALAEFEAFRKLNLEWTKRNIDSIVKQLSSLRDSLDGKMKGDCKNEQNQH